MGNELCVAGGGTPMQVDILVVNNTEIPLALDLDQDCQRDCHHKAWQVTISCGQLAQFYRKYFMLQLGIMWKGGSHQKQYDLFDLLSYF